MERFSFRTIIIIAFGLLLMAVLAWQFTSYLLVAPLREQSAVTNTTDSCCHKAYAFRDSLLEEKLLSIAEWKRPIIREQMQAIHFYCPNYATYIPVDSLTAASQYDMFITRTKKEHNLWKQIELVLPLVYETAREGDFNSGFEGCLFSQLKSGREKYIAYATDKMSGACGEFAAFTANILNDLGIAAGTLNFSSTDSSDNFIGLHTVAVFIANNKLYLLDPMFCRYYTLKSTAKPVDYVTLFKLVQQKKNAQIIPVVVPHGTGHGLWFDNIGCSGDSMPRYLLGKGLVKDDAPVEVTFANPENFPLRTDKLILDKGYLLDYYSFFAFPASVDGSDSFVQQAKQIIMKSLKIDI